MTRKVPVSEVADLPFNLSEEDISRGVASIRRQMEAAGLLPESLPIATSACCSSDISSVVQSKYINGEITEKAAIDELVGSGVSEEEARGMVVEWRGQTRDQPVSGEFD